MMRSDYYVYTYSYPNGVPFYVGKGCGRRDRVHLCDAKAGRNQSKWAVRVIGKIIASGEQPIITRIIENIDNELACFVEEEYIDKYGRKDIGTGVLVNCTSGGDIGAPALSPESAARKMAGLINWTRNERVVDVEYARRMSEGLKEYYRLHPVSDERKQRLSDAMRGDKNPFYGKTHDQEAVAKIVAANKGKVVSKEARAKQSAAMAGKHKGADNPYYGKKHSEEAKAKIAEAQQRILNQLKCTGKPHWNAGRTHTAETMAKLTAEKTCPHCGKIGRGSAMNRHHMANCKDRVV